MNEQTRERLEELLAVDALDGLDAAGRLELDGLLATGEVPGEDLNDLRTSFAEAAAALAMSLPPEAMDDGTVSRILGQPQADTDLIAEYGGDDDADPEDELARMREARHAGRGLKIVAGIVAAAVFVVLGGIGGRLILRPETTTTQAEGLSEFLGASGTTVSSFEATGPGAGTMKMASSNDSDEMYVFGSEVPPPPSGDVYQLWTITGQRAPVPGPTFASSPNGTVIAHVDLPHAGADLIAITMEPEGGSDAPTADPMYVAPMTAVAR